MIVVVTLAALAVGHIQLDAPLVRYSNTPREVNKSCPCGAGAGDDHCENGVLDDDNRSGNVSTFTAGETITVKFRETIGHTGRYRVSFSPDGATQEQFNAHELVDVADPSGAAGNTGDGNAWELAVTLPNTPCDNCVLQLIQDMGGNTTSPVGDLPNGHDLYFQCADIVLVAEGEGEAAVGEGEGEGAEGDNDGAGGDGCASSFAGAPIALLLLLRRRSLRR